MKIINNYFINNLLNQKKLERCAVFGHRYIKITDDLVNDLVYLFEELILKGCIYFYFGGFGMFDDLCYKIISDLKQKYPHIKRIFCLFDSKHQREFKRPNWLKNEEYEDYIYLDFYDYWYTRIYFRNCAIIDACDVVVFYVKNKDNSGAYKAYQYAKKQHKLIYNICEDNIL